MVDKRTAHAIYDSHSLPKRAALAIRQIAELHYSPESETARTKSLTFLVSSIDELAKENSKTAAIAIMTAAAGAFPGSPVQKKAWAKLDEHEALLAPAVTAAIENITALTPIVAENNFFRAGLARFLVGGAERLATTQPNLAADAMMMALLGTLPNTPLQIEVWKKLESFNNKHGQLLEPDKRDDIALIQWKFNPEKSKHDAKYLGAGFVPRVPGL